jgi:hypothetical protein
MPCKKKEQEGHHEFVVLFGVQQLFLLFNKYFSMLHSCKTGPVHLLRQTPQHNPAINHHEDKTSKRETLYELSSAFLAEAPRGLEAARSFFCCWESLTAEARATAAARRSER